MIGRGAIRNPGDFVAQCHYAYDKIKRVLALHGAALSDVVKITTYMTDLRYRLTGAHTAPLAANLPATMALPSRPS